MGSIHVELLKSCLLLDEAQVKCGECQNKI